VTALYHANVVLHVLAAVLWLGGLLFLVLIGAPAIRRTVPPEQRGRLFQQLEQRFALFAWSAILVLVLTGVGNLYFRGLLTSGVLNTKAFWATPFGRTLGWKLGLAAAMILVSAAHDFVLGPLAAEAEDLEQQRRLRRWAAGLARLNAALAVAVIVAAVLLIRGG
jgi:uncharacterized membrane protein